MAWNLWHSVVCVPATACQSMISAAFAAVSKPSSIIFLLPSLSSSKPMTDYAAVVVTVTVAVAVATLI